VFYGACKTGQQLAEASEASAEENGRLGIDKCHRKMGKRAEQIIPKPRLVGLHKYAGCKTDPR